MNMNLTDTKQGFWSRAWSLYRDGFKNLSPYSRTLWLIIAIKLFVMFAVLKVFFFPNYTKQQAKEHNVSGNEWVQQDLINRARK